MGWRKTEGRTPEGDCRLNAWTEPQPGQQQGDVEEGRHSRDSKEGQLREFDDCMDLPRVREAAESLAWMPE